MLSVSSHQCGCAGVGSTVEGHPPKLCTHQGLHGARQGVRLSLCPGTPGEGAALGYVREQVWAVLRLPAPACTRPTPQS